MITWRGRGREVRRREKEIWVDSEVRGDLWDDVGISSGLEVSSLEIYIWSKLLRK